MRWLEVVISLMRTWYFHDEGGETAEQGMMHDGLEVWGDVPFVRYENHDYRSIIIILKDKSGDISLNVNKSQETIS